MIEFYERELVEHSLHLKRKKKQQIRLFLDIRVYFYLLTYNTCYREGIYKIEFDKMK